MSVLRHQSALELLEILHELYAHQSLEAWRHSVPSLAARLVPCDVAAYTEIDTSRGKIESLFDSPEAQEEISRLHPMFELYAQQHPCLRHYQKVREGPPVKISDFLALNEYRKLALYNEFYGRFQLSRQMIVSLPSSQAVIIGLALNRCKRDFSEPERDLLDEFRKHLRQAYLNAQLTTRLQEEAARAVCVVDALGACVMQVTSEGRIVQSPPEAEALVASFFSQGHRDHGYLPHGLRRWVGVQAARLRPAEPGLLQPETWTVEQPNRRLIVRLLRDSQPERFLLALQARQSPSAASLAKWSLTQREADVLLLVAQGMTNAQIAERLAISPQTVKTHVERIFNKLDVHTRTEAAAMALRQLASREGG